MKCAGWLFFKCLTFIYTISLANFTNTPSPTNDSDSKFDNNLVYLIVIIVGLFVIALVAVFVATVYQRKTPVSRLPPIPIIDQPPPTQWNPTPIPIINQSPPTQGDPTPVVTSLWWEIPAEDLNIYFDKILGSGQFGVIILGAVVQKNQEKRCAIKTLKGDASKGERQSLKNELQNMSNMDPHPNIVNLIGARTINIDNYLVVVEYCENGDLYKYLKKHRNEAKWVGDPDGGTTIEYISRIRIAFDIANGMSYLSTKGFIHRDLAARNVLLDGELRGKVSDFGRSRDIAETKRIFESLRMKNEPIPTRWMPVETLKSKIFTTKSDVWSFGVLLWEIESGGIRPYNSENTYRQVVDKVVYQGYRLEQPSQCSQEIYDIMVRCWKINATERPSFADLAEIFAEKLKENLMAGN